MKYFEKLYSFVICFILIMAKWYKQPYRAPEVACDLIDPVVLVPLNFKALKMSISQKVLPKVLNSFKGAILVSKLYAISL